MLHREGVHVQHTACVVAVASQLGTAIVSCHPYYASI